MNEQQLQFVSDMICESQQADVETARPLKKLYKK